MSHEKAPAFQFYPKDFLSDALQSSMSLPEVGAYIRMMCIEWNEQGRGIPDNAVKCARMVGTTDATMKRIWQSVRACFRVHPAAPGMLIHPRLQKERDKQEVYRRRQSDRGLASAAVKRATKRQPEVNHGSTAVQPEVNQASTKPQPEANQTSTLLSPISYLLSPKQPSVAAAGPRRARPLAGYVRLRIFPWMVDDLIGTLGDFSGTFDLDAWLSDLDRDGSRVLKETWPWLKDELIAECMRRNLPIATAGGGASQAGKLTTRMASMLQNIAKEGR